MTENIVLKPNEKIESLDEKHAIIQSADGYRFGSDAVALSKLASAHIKSTDRVFDLCSGCGIIGILVAIATGCSVDGAELDSELWDMSVRSCALNGLDNVNFFNLDIRELDRLSASAYNAVVCNPPYYKAQAKARKVAPTANSELTVTFTDVVKAAKRLLKVSGSLYLVHTASRLDEILSVCRNERLTPKELYINPNGKTFMLRAVLGGNDGLNVSVKEF